MTVKRSVISVLRLLMVISTARATGYQSPQQGDFLIRDFRFKSGEVLPELKLHYTTLGTAVKDSSGMVRNAVLILHGAGGSGDPSGSNIFKNCWKNPTTKTQRRIKTLCLCGFLKCEEKNNG